MTDPVTLVAHRPDELALGRRPTLVTIMHCCWRIGWAMCLRRHRWRCGDDQGNTEHDRKQHQCRRATPLAQG